MRILKQTTRAWLHTYRDKCCPKQGHWDYIGKRSNRQIRCLITLIGRVMAMRHSPGRTGPDDELG